MRKLEQAPTVLMNSMGIHSFCMHIVRVKQVSIVKLQMIEQPSMQFQWSEK